MYINSLFTDAINSSNYTMSAIQLDLVQNILSPSLQPKNIKIKTYNTVILPFVLHGCETWSLTMREEHRLSMLRKGCSGRYLDLKGKR
jgi:hypothetical protein